MNDRPRAPLEVSAREAATAHCSARPLIDIRSEQERQAGHPTGAVVQDVEELIERSRGRVDHGGYIICAEGVRSLEAVKRLRALGLHGFSSVAGGFRAWRQADLAIGVPEGLDERQAERYARHLVMPQVGPVGQRKLLDSRILLLGMGGLNSPAALYLAAAGVGTLGLLDFDRVDRSNLQRQVVHAEDSLGQNKAVSAAHRIAALNPEVKAEIIESELTPDNASGLVEGWDVVIDGTDSFPARYAVNDACIHHGVPLVYGAVMRFQGQVSVFWPAAGDSRPCFRCLMPEAPAPADAPSCAEAGVLGVLPGLVGTLQATEALKILLSLGQSLQGRLLLIDALSMEFREMKLAANPACRSCGGCN